MKAISKVGLSLLLCYLCIFGLVMQGTSEERFVVTLDAGVTLYFNGIPIVCNDNTGNVGLPIICNDKLYITAVGLSQITGKSVEYNNKTQRLYIGRNPKFEPLSLRSLADFDNNDRTKTRKLWYGLTSSSDVDVIWKTSVQTSIYSESKDSEGSPQIKFLNILVASNQCYIPIMDIASDLDLVVEKNDYQFGFDIFTTSFYEAVEAVRFKKESKVPIDSKNMYGFKYYLLNNIFKDSGSAYSIKFSRYTDGTITYSVNPEFLTSVQETVDVNQKKIKAIIESLNLQEDTIEQKIVKINKWICDNNSYDQSVKSTGEVTTARSVTNILGSKEQICEGYSRLFMMLCKEAGINSQYLVGYVTMNGKTICHAWNRVFVDGTWLYCDVTMNDASKDNTTALLKTEQELILKRKESCVAIRY